MTPAQIAKGWKFVCDSYEGMPYSPCRADWSDADIIAFVDEHHIDGLSSLSLT